MRFNKVYVLVTLLILFSTKLFSQIYDPVKWTFSAVKEKDMQYNIFFTASIAPGWHVYSHIQPKDAIASPLKIKYMRNRGLQLQGKGLELGTLEKYYDKMIGVSANQYSNKLTVRQTVRVISSSTKQVKGVLTYQTCNDERCLPAEDVEFAINLR